MRETGGCIFFKEGKQIDPASPPDLLQTREMRQAMSVLVDFSEQEKNYLLYEQRLEAERVELTWRRQLEQAAADLEQERQVKEQLLRKVEQEHQAKEQERQVKEQLQREME